MGSYEDRVNRAQEKREREAIKARELERRREQDDAAKHAEQRSAEAAPRRPR